MTRHVGTLRRLLWDGETAVISVERDDGNKTALLVHGPAAQAFIRPCWRRATMSEGGAMWVISMASYRAAKVAAQALPHILTMDRRPPDCLLAVQVEVVDGEPVVVALVTDIRTLTVTFPKRIGTGGGHLVPVLVRSVAGHRDHSAR